MILAPDQVFMLVLHSDEIDNVQLGYGDQHNCVVVLHEGDSSLVHVILDEGTLTTQALLGNFVRLDLPFKQCFYIVNIDTWCLCHRELLDDSMSIFALN